MWSRQETLPQGSTPPHLPGASPGTCVQELRLLRPGCGCRKSWISEQGDVTHRRPGGVGPWLTSEARGVGGVDTAGSVPGRSGDTWGRLAPALPGGCQGVMVLVLMLLHQRVRQQAGWVPRALPTEHPPHRSLRSCQSAALPQAGLSVASSGAHRDTGPRFQGLGLPPLRGRPVAGQLWLFRRLSSHWAEPCSL